MFKKIVLLLSITTLLTACGGGGGSNTTTTQPDPDDPVVVPTYDLYSYLTRAKPDSEADLQREFITKEFFYEDGTPAWFDVLGISTNEPFTDEEKENAFSSLKMTKIMMTLNQDQTLQQTTTKFTPYGSFEHGPYFIGDHDQVELHTTIGLNTVTQNRETAFNKNLSDFTILDKYNWHMPRIIKNYHKQLFNVQNSHMSRSNASGTILDTGSLKTRTGTDESCGFVFKDAINLWTSVTHLAPKGLVTDILVMTCHIFPVGSDTSVGYRTTYYAKGIGEIHQITSLGQGIVHHVITERSLHSFNP